MNDIISVNRQFLIMAREAARTKSGEIVTGLSRPVLDKLASLSLDQIEEVAQGTGVSLINIRLNEAELDRLIKLGGNQRMAYSVAVTASRDR